MKHCSGSRGVEILVMVDRVLHKSCKKFLTFTHDQVQCKNEFYCTLKAYFRQFMFRPVNFLWSRVQLMKEVIMGQPTYIVNVLF